jgi:hypothetical protein
VSVCLLQVFDAVCTAGVHRQGHMHELRARNAFEALWGMQARLSKGIGRLHHSATLRVL